MASSFLLVDVHEFWWESVCKLSLTCNWTFDLIMQSRWITLTIAWRKCQPANFKQLIVVNFVSMSNDSDILTCHVVMDVFIRLSDVNGIKVSFWGKQTKNIKKFYFFYTNRFGEIEFIYVSGWRCKAYGHRTGDRECPMFISGNKSIEKFRMVRVT